MAGIETLVKVYCEDAPKIISTTVYSLATQMEDDFSNAAAVVTAIAAVETNLNILTQDKVTRVEMILRMGGGGADAAITANNQVHARTYVRDTSGVICSFDVPAWDDPVFSQTPDNLLSPAYNTAAGILALLLRDVNRGTVLSGGVIKTKSLTHKGRGKKA